MKTCGPYTQWDIIQPYILKKENPALRDNMDEPWGHYANEISQFQRTTTAWFRLHEASRTVKQHNGVPRGWGWGQRGLRSALNTAVSVTEAKWAL